MNAASLRLRGEVDRPSMLYSPGEPITFRFSLTENGRPEIGKRLKWTRTGDDGKTEVGEGIVSTGVLEVVTVLDRPGFVRVQVSAFDEAGDPLRDEKGKQIAFNGGAGVRPEQLIGMPEPADFDLFWQLQREQLSQVPAEPLERKPLARIRPGVDAWDIKIACLGGRPVSGYLFVPAGAAPRSVGARVNFQSYGVQSATRDDAQADGQEGLMIVLTINAHGIENGMPDKFYRDLERTSLKNYAFNRAQNRDPKTAYFYGMALRVLRALDFVKSLPEWDGEKLVVHGVSQGGFQALIAAGLDRDVSGCVVQKPWACDLGGSELGRMAGWRPDYSSGLGYFDPINHAKRIRAQTSVTAGLGDYVCPPSGLAILYNNIPDDVPKRIVFCQGATHSANPPGMAEHVVGNRPAPSETGANSGT